MGALDEASIPLGSRTRLSTVKTPNAMLNTPYIIAWLPWKRAALQSLLVSASGHS